MRRAEIAAALREEYARKLEAKREVREARVREVIARAPEAEDLIYAGPNMLLQQAKLLISDPAAAKAGAAGLRAEAEKRQKALKAALVRLGYPEDWLDIRYDCPVCRDTGYVENPVREECQCFRREVARRAHLSAADSTAQAQTFEAFDEARLPEGEPGPDGLTQRAHTLLVRDACRRFADDYPHTAKRGILLTGGTGLGKTFLLNCVDNALCERGFETTRVTAFSMFEAMRAYHFAAFGGEEARDAFGGILRCGMLLIDDLGTEPLMPNVTVEYLFTLLNERLVNRRHTMIATNLTPRNLRERYGERVYSRLIDAANMAVYPLFGRDLRRGS